MSAASAASQHRQAGLLADKLYVGLTGGIGSGKSTVSELFSELGTTVIDSDAISHRLTQAGGDAVPQIRTAFGAEFLDADGALDRPKMRQRVFSDRAAKLRLEAILHPLIRAHMLEQALAAQSSYVMLVVPLLFETPNYRELVQRTLVVDCPETVQVERTVRRSGLSEAEVRAIIAQQMARAERLRLADDIIHNDGSLDELRQQVAMLHETYSRLSSVSPYLPSRSD